MHDCAATAALVSIAHCVIAMDTARVHDAVVMRTCLLTSLVHSPVAMRMKAHAVDNFLKTGEAAYEKHVAELSSGAVAEKYRPRGTTPPAKHQKRA